MSNTTLFKKLLEEQRISLSDIEVVASSRGLSSDSKNTLLSDLFSFPTVTFKKVRVVKANGQTCVKIDFESKHKIEDCVLRCKKNPKIFFESLSLAI